MRSLLPFLLMMSVSLFAAETKKKAASKPAVPGAVQRATKAIGEQIVASGGIPFTIVRPSIVESTVKYPFVGWNEGINTSAPLIYALREGQTQIPGSDNNLDMIPCDMVAGGMALVLTVGLPRPRMGWLFVALAPGFFSGIAAAFVLVPIVARLFFGDGQMSPALNALDLFGWCSGAFAILLAVKRHRFLAAPRGEQRWWAILIWIVHIVALALFILIGPAYL